jgi:methylated-DNA-[protein]-cysteine S-methyltransferase
MRTVKTSSKSLPTLSVFPTDLGWMALLTIGDAVRELTFGHSSETAARKALRTKIPECAPPGKRQNALARRLQAYAKGKPDDFRDVPVDFDPATPFQASVWRHCRNIPFGQTLSYSELAADAGFTGAARAVGTCMARNRIPLIIPCHRVVRSDNTVGPYSAPGGTCTKRRLLALESQQLA